MSKLNDADLQFLAETVHPGEKDLTHILDHLREQEDLVDSILEDPRLVARLRKDEEAMVRISPGLLFQVLLRQVARTLAKEAYVYEIESRGRRLPVFDAPRVAELLSTPLARDYLVALLTSFTRTRSSSVYWVEKGGWRKHRFSDLDMDDMITLAGLVDPPERPNLHRRIADIALFLSGIYPQHASMFIARPRRVFRPHRTTPDYEEDGRRFYTVAAQEAETLSLREACGTLAEKFTLARYALNTLSDRYLKHLKPVGGSCSGN